MPAARAFDTDPSEDRFGQLFIAPPAPEILFYHLQSLFVFC